MYRVMMAMPPRRRTESPPRSTHTSVLPRPSADASIQLPMTTRSAAMALAIQIFVFLFIEGPRMQDKHSGNGASSGHLPGGRPRVRRARAEHDAVDGEQEAGEHHRNAGRDREPPRPGVAPRHRDVTGRRSPLGGQLAVRTADALHLLRHARHQHLELTALLRAVPAVEAEQQAELIDLEHIGDLRRVLLLKQPIEIAEKHLSADVTSTKELILERLPRPV